MKWGWTGLFLAIMLMVAVLPAKGSDISEADALYDAGGLENYLAAIDLYKKAVDQSPQSYELNWKCARALREYGEEAKKQNLSGWEDTCAQYGKAGMAYALTAISLSPDGVEGHYYYGLSVGIYSDGVSIVTALKEGLKKKTQASFEKAYALNKMYGEAGPVLSLGRFWSVLPWPLYDRKKALVYLREYQETAFFVNSDQAHIYLAELLMKLKGKENRQEATSLLEMAAKSKEKYYQDWALQLLQK